jgi:hypothetical protein
MNEALAETPGPFFFARERDTTFEVTQPWRDLMRQLLKAVGLLGTALLAIGAAPAPELVKPIGAVDVVPRRHRVGFLVDLNEIRLSIFGGYHGERLGKITLRPLRRLDDMRLYLRTRSDNLYVDRDGDGRLDACAIYNPQTGILSADFDCNGTGDQILVDLKPPPPVRSPEDLARRLSQHTPS